MILHFIRLFHTSDHKCNKLFCKLITFRAFSLKLGIELLFIELYQVVVDLHALSYQRVLIVSDSILDVGKLRYQGEDLESVLVNFVFSREGFDNFLDHSIHLFLLMKSHHFLEQRRTLLAADHSRVHVHGEELHNKSLPIDFLFILCLPQVKLIGFIHHSLVVICKQRIEKRLLSWTLFRSVNEQLQSGLGCWVQNVQVQNIKDLSDGCIVSLSVFVTDRRLDHC